MGLALASGALVSEFTKVGPAEAAGLKKGDIILSFNDREVDTMRKLPRIVAETPIGKAVPVTVWREGRKVSVQAKIGELEAAEKNQLALAKAAPNRPRPSTGRLNDLGLDLSVVTDSLRQQYTLGKDVKGVVVTDLDSDGVAAVKGLRPGDVIVEVNQNEVATPDDVIQNVEQVRKRGMKSVLMLVSRRGEMQFVALRLKKG
ncbi:MAG: PDZ domain-containing protein [Pseudomonadota bacterium]|nr:PDZ domain-containing protein [Pseudomonadota bacterium]